MDMVDYDCLNLIENVQNSPFTKIVANPQTMRPSLSIYKNLMHHGPPLSSGFDTRREFIHLNLHYSSNRRHPL